MKLIGRSHLLAREEAGSGCQPDREGKGVGLPVRGEKRKEWAGLLVGPRRRKERRRAKGRKGSAGLGRSCCG